MSDADLELSREAMKTMGASALKAVVEHIGGLRDAPCINLDNAARILTSFRESPPEEGEDFSKLLEFLMDDVFPLSVNTPHPRFMGFIPGGGLFPSALGDFISAATNRYCGVWFEAPAAVRLESNVLEWFAEWMHYPAEARGILTSGGSLANFSAVVTARRHILGEDIGQGVMYVSDQAHHCILKSAMLAGIKEEHVRVLPTDEHFRADPETFEDAIREDKKRGLKPFLLVASAGTTNTGAVDPLVTLREIAERHDLWYHVDAAYGGFFHLCGKGRQKLKGLPDSQSMVLDPHKGLFLPYGTGCLLVRQGDLLREAHRVTADYMQDLTKPPEERDPSEYSPELTRPNRGLRVWLPIKLFGINAFRKNLEEKLDLTEWMYDRFLEEPGFQCVTEPELSVIAFKYIPRKGDVKTFNRKLIQSILGTQKLFLSSTMLRGEFVIRVCILSFRTHKREAEEAFDIIRSCARSLERS